MYLVGKRKLLLPVVHSLLYTSTAAANKLVDRTNSKRTATLPACLMATEAQRRPALTPLQHAEMTEQEGYKQTIKMSTYMFLILDWQCVASI